MPEQVLQIAKRFNLEYDIACSIQSKYTVKAYKKGKINGNPCYTMDFCSGGNLFDLFRQPLTEKQIISIIIPVLNGLNDMHKKGYIHRDLKPENILFNQNGQALLADFGISAYLNNRFTSTNWSGKVKDVWGTVQYMPPEQLKDTVKYNDTGTFTDIFAFGVTLYETITQGKLPYGDFQTFAANPEAYVSKVRKGEWIDIKKIKPNISPILEKIIIGCLQPEIKKRYKDTKEILDLINHEATEKFIIPQITENKPLIGNILLRVMYGEEPEKVYNLTKLINNKGNKLLTLGYLDKHDTKNSNDIGINETLTQWISGRHATLELTRIEINNEQIWYIRDGQFYDKGGVKKWHLSRNGVLVNSVPINQNGVSLRYGDIITIGETTLRVEII